MSRQGKLHSSPFHVESSRYIFAVEKENSGYEPKNEDTTCEYRHGSVCRLWNSGYKTCASFKCRYHRESLRRSFTCDDCGFIYNSKCRHSKTINKKKIPKATGSYCCFFVGKEATTYETIRRAVQHDGCSEQCIHLEQQIKGWENSIKQYQFRASAASSAEEKTEYMRKISDREKWISSARKQLLNLKKQDIEDIC